MIGYKLLQADGGSLRGDGRVMYPLPADGEPGEWINVPGNGAYVAVTGGLMSGGMGKLLAEVEGAEPTGAAAPEGVVCYRCVRVLRAHPWETFPPDLIANFAQDRDWTVRFAIAERVGLAPEIEALLAKDTDPDVRCAIAGREEKKA